MYLVKLNDGTSFKTRENIDKIFEIDAKVISGAEFFIIPDTGGYKHYIPKHSLVEIMELSSC